MCRTERSGITVVLCCFNSSDRITETLSHIKRLEVPPGGILEVIVINNGSTDNTVDVVKSVWNSNIPLRIIEEARSGLSWARRRGAVEADTDIIVYVDDDNHLQSDYAKIISQRFNDEPNLAVIGGCGFPKFDSSPPPWFEVFSSAYAVGKIDKNTQAMMVYGASMAIRRSPLISLYNLGSFPILSDRRGSKLSAGGDGEICMAMRLIGYTIDQDERLVFQHLIPRNRLEWGYLLSLKQGFGASSTVLSFYKMYFSYPFSLAYALTITRSLRALIFAAILTFKKKTLIDHALLSYTKGMCSELGFSLARILKERSYYVMLKKLKNYRKSISK